MSKYFTKESLIAANKVAIKTKRNRTLEPKKLKALDADGLKFPVGFTMIHNDCEMRVQIALGEWGKDGEPSFLGSVFLDIPFETFASLPEIEAA